MLIWIGLHAIGAAPAGGDPWLEQSQAPNGYGRAGAAPVEGWLGPSPPTSPYAVEARWPYGIDAPSPYGVDVSDADPGPPINRDFGPSAAGRFDPIRFPIQAGDIFSPLVPWEGQTRVGWHPLGIRGDADDWYRVDVQVRGFYVNDQRIVWSGMEETFAAEGAILPMFRHRFDCCELIVLGELYLNEPFDRNVLVDTPERRSYAANFEVQTLQLSQLYLALRRDDLELAFGKMVTPFGRTYFPLFTNARFDAPFIRTEAIHWRETGLLLRYDPSWLVCDLALTNGSDDRDTNSSKAMVSRVGFRAEQWAGGLSIKLQDGVGSESQKQYNNHLGVDLMHRCSILTLSGEVVYDQYGFRKPGFDLNNITWGRSTYYRDLNKAPGRPIRGVGYYVNVGLERDRWMAAFCYGEFYPEAIGDPRHDVTIRRGILKLDCDLARQLDAYAAVILETGGYLAQDHQLREGTAVLAGIQYTF